MAVNSSVIDDLLKKYVSSDKDSVETIRIAAFIVTGKNGETIYSNALGDLNFEENSPSFTTDSVCWVASMTKLVTAVSVMQLVEKGKVGINDDLGKLIPELANKEIIKGFGNDGKPIFTKATRPVTLRNLLTHSSGFAYEGFHPLISKWSKETNRTTNLDWSMKTGDPKGLDIPLVFNPDEGWTYGIGNDWAGQVVEVLSGLSLEEYMKQNIFKPLGMSSSTFFLSEHPDIASRRAAIAKRPSDTSALISTPDEAPINSKLASGGGGLFTTPNDYAKFLTAIVSGNDKLLKPESVKTLFEPQLDNPSYFEEFADGLMRESVLTEFPRGIPLNYALGGGVNMEDVPEKRRKGSMMWSGVTNPRWWIDPETGIAATLFTQISPFGDKVTNRLFGEPEKAVYKTLR